MKEDNIDLLKERFLQEIKEAKTAEERRKISKKYLDKELSAVFRTIKELSSERKGVLGRKANELKSFIAEHMEEVSAEEEESVDVTLPGKNVSVGRIHPLTQALQRCGEIFSGMGFSVVEGPEVEDEWHNFDALNFEHDHPSREMQDTLFLKQNKRESLSSSEKLLMRTHTSPVQIRYMLENKPPLRIVVPGRVFRNEATDSSHEINFYQLEGMMVGEDVSVANFRAVIGVFFQKFFGKDTRIRLRPSFFPFTEPSFEVDISCSNCSGKGCSVCKRTGWLEVMGAGMVHPNVLKNAGVDSDKYRGFAFGVGVDRLVMLRYKIDDIRLFYSADARFLKQF